MLRFHTLAKLLLYLFISLAVFSCSDEKAREEFEDFTLEVSAHNVELLAAGLSEGQYIYVRCNGDYNYSVEYQGAERDWLNIEKSDSYLYVTPATVSGTSQRNALLKISKGKLCVNVDITQAAFDSNTDISSILGVNLTTCVNDYGIGKDGHVTVAEAVQLDTLICPLDYFDKLDLLKYFPNLVYLTLSSAINYSADTGGPLDLSLLPKLQDLYVGPTDDGVRIMALNEAKKLKNVGLSHITSDIPNFPLDFSNMPDLERLSIDGTKCGELNITNCPKLRFLELYGTCLSSLNIRTTGIGVNYETDESSLIIYDNECSETIFSILATKDQAENCNRSSNWQFNYGGGNKKTYRFLIPDQRDPVVKVSEVHGINYIEGHLELIDEGYPALLSYHNKGTLVDVTAGTTITDCLISVDPYGAHDVICYLFKNLTSGHTYKLVMEYGNEIGNKFRTEELEIYLPEYAEPVVEAEIVNTGVFDTDLKLTFVSVGCPAFNYSSYLYVSDHPGFDNDEAIFKEQLYNINTYENGETKEIKVKNLVPNTVYYAYVKFCQNLYTEAKYTTSPTFTFRTADGNPPSAHITSLEASAKSVTAKFVLDNAGTPAYLRPVLTVGTTPDFAYKDRIASSRSDDIDWWRVGKEYTLTVEKLEPETKYYAKLFLIWGEKDNLIHIPVETIDFETSADVSIYMQSLRVSRESYNHIGGGMFHFLSNISASATYAPANLNAEFYFETDIWGDYSYTKKTSNSIELKCPLEWYWTMEGDKPRMKMRAVIVYKGHKYYSNWLEYSL